MISEAPAGLNLETGPAMPQPLVESLAPLWALVTESEGVTTISVEVVPVPLLPLGGYAVESLPEPRGEMGENAGVPLNVAFPAISLLMQLCMAPPHAVRASAVSVLR